MQRAMLGNIHELASLLLGKLAHEADRDVDSIQPRTRRRAVCTVCCMHLRVRQLHVHLLQRPATAFGKHLYGDGGARAERRQKQLVRIRGTITAAHRNRLIRLQRMRADGNILDVLVRAGLDCNDSFHSPSSLQRAG